MARHKALLDNVESIRNELNESLAFRNIVGRSCALLRVLAIAARVAKRETPIFIIGETGTGKDLLARAIHESSGYPEGVFRKINCASAQSQSGDFDFQGLQKLRTGTLYLDCVSELPLNLQLRLLQLIQDSPESQHADGTPPALRIIASTPISLSQLLSEGKLRPDLYYRLSVLPLTLPPLRERKEDLPELVRFLLERLEKRHRIEGAKIASALQSRFARYHWPGNIRELENVLERMLLLSASCQFSEEDLPLELFQTEPSHALHGQLPSEGISLVQLERDLLLAALNRFGGNQSKAARYLNISRRTLIYRMEKHKLREVASFNRHREN